MKNSTYRIEMYRNMKSMGEWDKGCPHPFQFSDTHLPDRRRFGVRPAVSGFRMCSPLLWIGFLTRTVIFCEPADRKTNNDKPSSFRSVRDQSTPCVRWEAYVRCSTASWRGFLFCLPLRDCYPLSLEWKYSHPKAMLCVVLQPQRRP